MKYLILWELRRLFNKRNRVAIIVTATLLFAYLMISIIVNNPMLKQDGKASYGFHAVREATNANSSLYGSLQDNNFKKCYNMMHNIFDNPKNFDANGSIKNDIYAKEYKPYELLANLMTRIYSPPGSFDPKNVLKLNQNEVHVSDFYTKRIENIKELLKFGKYSPIEYNFLLNKANAIRKGSIIMNNTQGSIQLLKNFQIIQLAIILICIIVLSPIFSRDRQLRFDAIINSSKHGPSSLIHAKIIASFLAVFLLYFIFTGGSLLIQIGMFGNMNMTIPIQIDSNYWLSIFPFTFHTAEGWAILLGLCAILCMSAITIIISLFSKKDYNCLLLSLAILIIPKVLYDMHLLKSFFHIFPIHMLDINSYISSYDNMVYTLFGHPITVLNASMMFSLLMGVLLLVFGISIYRLSRR